MGLESELLLVLSELLGCGVGFAKVMVLVVRKASSFVVLMLRYQVVGQAKEW